LPYDPQSHLKKKRQVREKISSTTVHIARPLGQAISQASFAKPDGGPHLTASSPCTQLNESSPNGPYEIEDAVSRKTAPSHSCFPHISFEDATQSRVPTPYESALPPSGWEFHLPYHGLRNGAPLVPEICEDPFVPTEYQSFPALATGIDFIDATPIYKNDTCSFGLVPNSQGLSNPEYNLCSSSSSTSSASATPSGPFLDLLMPEQPVPYHSDWEPALSPLATFDNLSHFSSSVYPLRITPSRIFSSQ
jgi:hypothetical protein